MEQNATQYSSNDVLKKISSNLKKLLDENNMNQKQFSEKIGVSESTLSGYMKGSKSPGLSFLIDLKSHFPNISLDQFLFADLEDQKVPMTLAQDPISDAELSRYQGTYYLFYLDTNKKHNSRTEKNVHETIDLKNGILYVSNKSVSNNTSAVCCIAVFGIKKRAEAQKLKKDIDLLGDYDRICEYLREAIPHGLYFGQLHMSQMHIFISLNRAIDGKDNALIVLHHASINKDHYAGGLGTINSVATGRTSDPIVQLIALSKNDAYISDEQIKSQLWFAAPDIRVRGQSETAEILKLIETIYQFDHTEIHSEDSNSYIQFNEQNRKVMLQSYLEYLIMKNVENNRLWFGRVSSADDDDWYHLLKDSEAYHEKRKQGDEHGFTDFESSTDYLLY